MLDSSMKASLMAIMPTEGCLYQQGWPRRVMLLSIMSSETRKKAWRSSVSQPRVAVAWYWESVRGFSRRREAESGTERPRFSLPPMVL